MLQVRWIGNVEFALTTIYIRFASKSSISNRFRLKGSLLRQPPSLMRWRSRGYGRQAGFPSSLYRATPRQAGSFDFGLWISECGMRIVEFFYPQTELKPPPDMFSHQRLRFFIQRNAHSPGLLKWHGFEIIIRILLDAKCSFFYTTHQKDELTGRT